MYVCLMRTAITALLLLLFPLSRGYGVLYDDEGENIDYMSDDYSNTTIKFTHDPDRYDYYAFYMCTSCIGCLGMN